MPKINFLPQQIMVFIIFTLMMITAINFQTTVWFSFFGYFPEPNLWTPLFVYLMMNRSFPKNLLWLLWFYLLFLTHSSAVPMTLLASLATHWGLIYFFQKRISTLGLFDFILFSCASIVLFPITYFLYSLLGSSTPSLDVIHIFVSLILTLPMIPVTLVICKKIDAIFDRLNHNHEDLVLDI